MPVNLIDLIMKCISSSSFFILWDGGKSEKTFPSRGLHQGDPLSPYLFVIYMERLSDIITDAVDTGEWIPIKAGRGGPAISHLLFADDQLFFAEASVSQK